MRIKVLINAGAGTAEREQEEELRRNVTRMFADRNVAATIAFVSGAELSRAADDAVAAARRGDLDAVAVGGGDGSIHALSNVLAGTDIPFGVLPLGTLNHFAKDLGIPLDLEQAVDVICRADAQAVDAAEVNGQTFVNNSSIGLYPHMVLDRERSDRKGWAKWPAMALAAFRVLWTFPRPHLTVCVEGRAEPLRTPFLFVGNNEYIVAPGAFGKRESLERGELSIYVSTAQSRTALLRTACRAALGRLNAERDLAMAKAASAEIRSPKNRLLVAFDGEVATLKPPLRYRIRPGALRVFAPHPAASE